MNDDISKKAGNIKLFVTDVDGVLTDGKIYLGNNGEEYKAFHVHDGMGIKIAQQEGIIVAIITAKQSNIVKQRAEMLNIKEVYQHVSDKLAALESLLRKYDLTFEQTAYIGDDLNDLEVLKKVGLAFTVANGIAAVKDQADYVTSRNGGEGAVREALDLLVSVRKNNG